MKIDHESSCSLVPGRVNAQSSDVTNSYSAKLIVAPKIPTTSADNMLMATEMEEEIKSPPRMTSNYARQLPQSDAKNRKGSPQSKKKSSNSSSIS